MCVLCRFCDLVNTLTEEAWRGSDETECESEALEVLYYVKYKKKIWNAKTLCFVDGVVNSVCVCVHVCLQYDYEYDEHGDRVVLGKGTFGVVYAGRDLSNQVRLAIKEIPERDSRWAPLSFWSFH